MGHTRFLKVYTMMMIRNLRPSTPKQTMLILGTLLISGAQATTLRYKHALTRECLGDDVPHWPCKAGCDTYKAYFQAVDELIENPSAHLKKMKDAKKDVAREALRRVENADRRAEDLQRRADEARINRARLEPERQNPNKLKKLVRLARRRSKR